MEPLQRIPDCQVGCFVGVTFFGKILNVDVYYLTIGTTSV
jgi:hypothetical protein